MFACALRSGRSLQKLSRKLIELKANTFLVTESGLTRAHSGDAQDRLGRGDENRSSFFDRTAVVVLFP